MEIESKGVSVTLSGREIVHRVSVQVKDRQFVGLLGPNGSGKTTLLKSIYRVLKPSEGAVCIDGEDIRRMSYRESAKRTGVVSQFTFVCPAPWNITIGHGCVTCRGTYFSTNICPCARVLPSSVTNSPPT